MKNKTPSPDSITTSSVLYAAKFWDKNGHFEDYGLSTRYDVLVGGKAYPPKAICGIAYHKATGQNLSSKEFKGAERGPWQGRLRELGFEVVPKGESGGTPSTVALEPAVRKMLKVIGQGEQVVVLTQNKKLNSRENFRKLPGRSGKWRDGDWTGTPKSDPDWGVHYEAELGGGGRLWYGRWVESQPCVPQADPARHVFIYRDVVGPIETAASFKEVFGLSPQAPFIYLDPPDPAITRDVKKQTKLKKELQQLLDELKAKSLEGTDAEAVVKRRLHGGKLNAAVRQIFRSQCCITGIGHLPLLVCSHIRPWARSTDHQKIDPSNILLLAANWDALFDRFLISFDPDGCLRISKTLDGSPTLQKMGIGTKVRLAPEWLTPERKKYLQFHLNELERRDRSAKSGQAELKG